MDYHTCDWSNVGMIRVPDDIYRELSVAWKSENDIVKEGLMSFNLIETDDGICYARPRKIVYSRDSKDTGHEGFMTGKDPEVYPLFGTSIFFHTVPDFMSGIDLERKSLELMGYVGDLPSYAVADEEHDANPYVPVHMWVEKSYLADSDDVVRKYNMFRAFSPEIAKDEDGRDIISGVSEMDVFLEDNLAGKKGYRFANKYDKIQRW